MFSLSATLRLSLRPPIWTACWSGSSTMSWRNAHTGWSSPSLSSRRESGSRQSPMSIRSSGWSFHGAECQSLLRTQPHGRMGLLWGHSSRDPRPSSWRLDLAYPSNCLPATRNEGSARAPSRIDTLRDRYGQSTATETVGRANPSILLRREIRRDVSGSIHKPRESGHRHPSSENVTGSRLGRFVASPSRARPFGNDQPPSATVLRYASRRLATPTAQSTAIVIAPTARRSGSGAKSSARVTEDDGLQVEIGDAVKEKGATSWM